eukprot:351092-Chlamydomonas_euryale.AAC.3
MSLSGWQLVGLDIVEAKYSFKRQVNNCHFLGENVSWSPQTPGRPSAHAVRMPRFRLVVGGMVAARDQSSRRDTAKVRAAHTHRPAAPTGTPKTSSGRARGQRPRPAIATRPPPQDFLRVAMSFEHLTSDVPTMECE